MYQPGDMIIYGSTGVCEVKEITTPDFEKDKSKQYYALAPVYQDGMIFVPVDTKVFMRPILTKAQAEELIEQIPQIQGETFEGKDVRALSEQYKGCLDTHQCEDLVKLIKTVYQKEKLLVESGKKLAKTEQEFGKLAKELLHREFSMALELPFEEVEEYIVKKVEALSK